MSFVPNVRLNVCWMPRIIKKTILKNPIRMNLIKMNRIMGKRILTYQIFGKRILKNFDFIFYMWNNEYICICFSTQYMWVKHCIQFRVFFFFFHIYSQILRGRLFLLSFFQVCWILSFEEMHGIMSLAERCLLFMFPWFDGL